MAVVERNVERWASECLYTSYVTIPGLRYRGAGRCRPGKALMSPVTSEVTR